MNQIDVEKYQELLTARQAELESQNDLTQADIAPVELDQSSVGRLSRMDALQQQAMGRETRRRRAAELVRIKAALQRIEDGEFGCCQICGEEIAQARLDLDPSVANCIKHA